MPYATECYTKEVRRLYGGLEARLREALYLAGEDYSIADIATYPRVARWEWHCVDLAQFPQVQAWFERVGSRPVVQKEMAVPSA